MMDHEEVISFQELTCTYLNDHINREENRGTVEKVDKVPQFQKQNAQGTFGKKNIFGAVEEYSSSKRSLKKPPSFSMIRDVKLTFHLSNPMSCSILKKLTYSSDVFFERCCPEFFSNAIFYRRSNYNTPVQLGLFKILI